MNGDIDEQTLEWRKQRVIGQPDDISEEIQWFPQRFQFKRMAGTAEEKKAIMLTKGLPVEDVEGLIKHEEIYECTRADGVPLRGTCMEVPSQKDGFRLLYLSTEKEKRNVDGQSHG